MCSTASIHRILCAEVAYIVFDFALVKTIQDVSLVISLFKIFSLVSLLDNHKHQQGRPIDMIENLVKTGEHLVKTDGLEEKTREFLGRGERPCDYEAQLLKDTPRLRAIFEGKVVPPVELEIQTTSVCNLKCGHCFGREYEPIKGEMSIDEIEMLAKRIDEFVEGEYNIKTVKFCGTTGEPLVNPATIQGIPLFKQMGKEVIVYTNGLFLDRIDLQGHAYYETVAQADKINLSLDADCESTFRELKGRTGFDRILHSLDDLVQRKQHKLVISYVIGTKNHQGIVAAAGLMKELGADEIWFRVDFTDTEGIREHSRDIIDDLKQAKELSSPAYKVMSIYSEDNILGDMSGFNSFGRKCYNSRFWACIGPDSNLYACGHRTHGGIVSYGSLLEHSFKELWTGKQRMDSIVTLPDVHCNYCSPSSTRRNDFMTFLSSLEKEEREEIFGAFGKGCGSSQG